MILAMQVGPWDTKRGIHTQVQPELPLPQPVPRVVVPPGQVEPELDVDAADVIKYAKENPLEDLDEGEQVDAAGESKAGGAAQHDGVVVDSVFDDDLIEQQERERKESEKRKSTSSLRLPVSVKQRIQEAEATKRPQEEGHESAALLVRFDPELPAQETLTETTKNRNV